MGRKAKPWTDGQNDVRKDGRTEQCRCADRRVDGLTDGPLERRTEGWTFRD